MTRPAMARLYAIDARIRQGRYPNCSSLARELEVSVRTVQRDVELLRDQLGAPLVYESKHRGFYYSSEDFALPASPLTARDISALNMAGQLLRLVIGSAFEEPVRRMLDRLASALPAGVSLGPQTASGLSFGLPPIRGDEAQVAAHLELLQEALSTRRTAHMRYYSAYRDAWQQRRLDPYHLHYRDGAWYAIGWCHWRKRVQTFAVDRMRELRLLSQGFSLRPGFQAEQHLASAWQIESGAPVAVAIRFQPTTARYIRERQWHPSQQLQDTPDGALVMRVQVAGLAEIARWVLQFGRAAEVLEPTELRRLVAAEAEGLARTYGQGGQGSAGDTGANTRARQPL